MRSIHDKHDIQFTFIINMIAIFTVSSLIPVGNLWSILTINIVASSSLAVLSNVSLIIYSFFRETPGHLYLKMKCCAFLLTLIYLWNFTFEIFELFNLGVFPFMCFIGLWFGSLWFYIRLRNIDEEWGYTGTLRNSRIVEGVDEINFVADITKFSSTNPYKKFPVFVAFAGKENKSSRKSRFFQKFSIIVIGSSALIQSLMQRFEMLVFLIAILIISLMSLFIVIHFAITICDCVYLHWAKKCSKKLEGASPD